MEVTNNFIIKNNYGNNRFKVNTSDNVTIEITAQHSKT